MKVSSKRISFDCRNRRRTGGALNEGIKIHGSASSLLRSSFFRRYLFFFFLFCDDRENNRQQPVARSREQ